MSQFQQTSTQPQRRRSGTRDSWWLSMLVDRFEEISRADRRAAPCDELILLAVKAHLAHPVSPGGIRRSDLRRLN
jgi:hypothetical protein